MGVSQKAEAMAEGMCAVYYWKHNPKKARFGCGGCGGTRWEKQGRKGSPHKMSYQAGPHSVVEEAGKTERRDFIHRYPSPFGQRFTTQSVNSPAIWGCTHRDTRQSALSLARHWQDPACSGWVCMKTWDRVQGPAFGTETGRSQVMKTRGLLQCLFYSVFATFANLKHKTRYKESPNKCLKRNILLLVLQC